MNAARLTIDLDALAHNHAVLRTAAGPAEVAPVVKADGYGLGAGPIARRLWAEGARTFFVARLSEGEALRAALGDRDATIFILDGLTEGAAPRLAAAHLTPVLSSLAQVEAWTGPAALHFDTGMNRIGIDAGQANDAARLARNLDLVLVMSHLSCAAEPGHPRNAAQLERFEAVRTAFPGVRASLAASAGIFLDDAYRADLVRPGISLFGGGPRETPEARFEAVATLDAPVLQVRDLKAGDSVGYGSMFTAGRAMRIAVLGAGYADGILRGAYAKGFASITGKRAPYIVVSMDMIAVDISDQGMVTAGDRAELLGPNVLLDDLAAAGNTVAHECLTRLNARAERVYLGAAGNP